MSGCWQNPQPPPLSTPDAYEWRATLENPGAEPYYRVPINPSLSDWMKQQDIESVALFDATGLLQQCGLLSGTFNEPLTTMSTPLGASVKPFNPAVCSNAPRPNICFKNHPCSVPDYCPFQEVDLTGTTLDGINSVEDIVAIGTARFEPVVCSPISGDGLRPCTDADRRTAAALQKAQTRRTEAIEFMNNFGLLPDAAGQEELKRIQNEDAQQREALVTLDRLPKSALELVFHWRATQDMPASSVNLSCFTSGSSSTGLINVPAMRAGTDAESHEWPQCGSLSYRIRYPAASGALELTSVSGTEYAPKPFMKSDPKQFWFAPKGTPPYSLLMEKGKGACGASLNRNEARQLPHAFDPDWPPAVAVVGTPQINQRSAWLVLRAARPDLAAWLYWLMYVGGTCAITLTGLLGYWMWLARGARGR